MNKPQENFVTYYRVEGNYNLLDSSEVSAQYIIKGIDRGFAKEKGFRLSYSIDIDKDYGYNPKQETVLDLALWIKDVFDGYWIHTGKQEIKNLVDYLEGIEEEQELLRAQYEVEYAKYKVHEWAERLSKSESNLMALSN